MKLLETDALRSIPSINIRDITIRVDQQAVMRKFRPFTFNWLGLKG